MDLEQIRKAMREGTFGQGVLDTKPQKDPKAPPPVVEEALGKVDPDRCPRKQHHKPGTVCAVCNLETPKVTPPDTTTVSQVSLSFQQGKSDKVYRIEVIRLTKTGHYQVIAYWGRRTAVNLQSQIKLETPYKAEAVNKADELEAEKRKKGYK